MLSSPNTRFCWVIAGGNVNQSPGICGYRLKKAYSNDLSNNASKKNSAYSRPQYWTGSRDKFLFLNLSLILTKLVTYPELIKWGKISWWKFKISGHYFQFFIHIYMLWIQKIPAEVRFCFLFFYWLWSNLQTWQILK